MILSKTIAHQGRHKQGWFGYLVRAGIVVALLVSIALVSGCKKDETRQVPTVTITSVNKTLFNIGDTIIIKGSNFSSVAADNLVSIGPVALQVISSTSTEIKAVIPEGVSGGQLSVAYAEGQATLFPGTLQVIVSGQPYVVSITPANSALGDTVLISGGNFATPYQLNSVTAGGGQLTIVNVTNTTIRAVISNSAKTGPVIVTTRGLVSQPYPIMVTRPNPLTDGRLYWFVPYRTNSYQPSPDYIRLYKGLDEGSAPYAAQASFDFYRNEISQPSGGTSSPELLTDYNNNGTFVKTNVVSDNNGNAYYLYREVINNDRAEYYLVKLVLKPAITRTVIWKKTVISAEIGYTQFDDPYAGPLNVINSPPMRIAIDGNQLYIQYGISTKFLVGDISTANTANSFTPTPVTYPIPENAVYGLEFGKNHVFYSIPYNNGNYYGPNIISELHYIPRSGGTVGTVPLPPDLTIVEYFTGANHDDNLLIYAIDKANNSNKILYKFNAATGNLTKLYDQDNWIDGITTDFNEDLNQGFLWAGNNIYYANKSRPLNSIVATGIYLLKDDGSSKRPLNVYGRIDLAATNVTYSSYIPLFIDKTQAKP